jgi:hypothetical protein
VPAASHRDPSRRWTNSAFQNRKLASTVRETPEPGRQRPGGKNEEHDLRAAGDHRCGRPGTGRALLPAGLAAALPEPDPGTAGGDGGGPSRVGDRRGRKSGQRGGRAPAGLAPNDLGGCLSGVRRRSERPSRPPAAGGWRAALRTGPAPTGRIARSAPVASGRRSTGPGARTEHRPGPGCRTDPDPFACTDPNLDLASVHPCGRTVGLPRPRTPGPRRLRPLRIPRLRALRLTRLRALRSPAARTAEHRFPAAGTASGRTSERRRTEHLPRLWARARLRPLLLAPRLRICSKDSLLPAAGAMDVPPLRTPRLGLWPKRCDPCT